MCIIIDCYENIKFYDYLLFDTVFLHRVNYMPIYLDKELFYYYQYENSILLTKKEVKNNNQYPGVLSITEYINYIHNRLKIEQFNINIDGYKQPIVNLKLNDISRKLKIDKIKKCM
jgi:hypothetical protein